MSLEKNDDVVFDQFNKKCVIECGEVLSNLNSIFRDLKKEDEVSIGDYKTYISTYRDIVELYYIGSRKNIKPTDADADDKIDDLKLEKLSSILYGNNSDKED